MWIRILTDEPDSWEFRFYNRVGIVLGNARVSVPFPVSWSWRILDEYRVQVEDGAWPVWGLSREEARERALWALRDLALPALQRKLVLDNKARVLKSLAQERQPWKRDWLALKLLKPRIELREQELRFSLGGQDWPRGARPLDLALEKFPELLFYLD
jgi:hypothetical protein